MLSMTKLYKFSFSVYECQCTEIFYRMELELPTIKEKNLMLGNISFHQIWSLRARLYFGAPHYILKLK